MVEDYCKSFVDCSRAVTSLISNRATERQRLFTFDGNSVLGLTEHTVFDGTAWLVRDYTESPWLALEPTVRRLCQQADARGVNVVFVAPSLPLIEKLWHLYDFRRVESSELMNRGAVLERQPQPVPRSAATDESTPPRTPAPGRSTEPGASLIPETRVIEL